MSRRFKVVLSNGCFDRFHYGHVLHLQEAARYGSFHVVSITADIYVNKGPDKPIYPQEHRAALVYALKCVDEVVIVPSLIYAMDMVQPDVLVKGIDYSDGLDPEHEAYCQAHEIEIIYTTTPKYSADEFYRSREDPGLQSLGGR